MNNIWLNLIRGFCMALADSVPGVSGGTIAFLLGFYDKFITSLDDLISGTKEKRIEAIKFLIKLGIGWVIGFLIAVVILASLFENQIYKISSIFLGLVIFSIPIIIMEEKEVLKGKYVNLIFSLIGIGVVVAISVFGHASDVNIANLSLGSAVYIFIAAAIAITAMVLPGISGSTLLLIFGLYVPIISGIKELLHFNFSYFPALVIFGLGVLTGIISIIKLIRKCLEKYRSQTIYTILGLMIGSVYAIIQGPKTLDNPKPAMNFSTFSIIFFIIGGVIIFGLQKLKLVIQQKEENK